MKKPSLLRDALVGAVPQLAAAPEKLALFIDAGRIGARAPRSLNFEYRYTLNLVVEDYAGDVDALFVPLLAWIRRYQRDLFDRAPGEPFSFESEILDGDAADVSIKLELTERVRVEETPAGLVVTHLDEPEIADAFPGVDDVRLMRVVLVDGKGAVAAELER